MYKYYHNDTLVEQVIVVVGEMSEVWVSTLSVNELGDTTRIYPPLGIALVVVRVIYAIQSVPT